MRLMAAKEILNWAGLPLRESTSYLNSRRYLEIPSGSWHILFKNKHLIEECKRTN
jgi:hypothetical protein